MACAVDAKHKMQARARTHAGHVAELSPLRDPPPTVRIGGVDPCKIFRAGSAPAPRCDQLASAAPDRSALINQILSSILPPPPPPPPHTVFDAIFCRELQNVHVFT